LVRRTRATHRSTTTNAFGAPFPRCWLRPVIMRHDAGIAASPPVRCILGVEWRGYTLHSLVRHGPGIHGSIRGHPASLNASPLRTPAITSFDLGDASAVRTKQHRLATSREHRLELSRRSRYAF
jgi:hypothetical protein